MNGHSGAAARQAAPAANRGRDLTGTSEVTELLQGLSEGDSILGQSRVLVNLSELLMMSRSRWCVHGVST